MLAILARATALLPRSEEHTSELQSQSNLVCRLLLEKKSPTLERQVAAVEDILRELELDRLPRLLVLNKADLVDPTQATVVSARLGGLAVSAVPPDTLLPLLDTVEKQLWSLTQAGLSC